MKITEPLPMSELVAVRLKHTSRDPAEWIVTLRDGRRAHIVSTKTNLLIAYGKDLNEALMKAIRGDVEKVPHKQPSRKIKTETMVEITGLNIGPDVVVNSKVPGDVS